jgi:predicted PurR-regulated permease PerM
MERPTGDTRAIRTLAFLTAVIAALYLGRQIFVPVALALLLTLVLVPLVDRCERFRIRRPFSAVILMGLLFVFFAWSGWMMTQQISGLARKLPEYKENLRAKTASIGEPFGGLLGRAYATIHELGEELATAGKSKAPPPPPEAVKVQVVPAQPTEWQVISYALGSMMGTVGVIFVVGILAVFLLAYWKDLHHRLVLAFGTERMQRSTRAMQEATSSVGRFLLAQVVVNTCYGTVIGVSLVALGVPNALLWGFLAAILRFIPFLGPWLGAAGPFILSLAVFEGWSRPLFFLAIMAALEFVTANLVEPLFYGSRTGLSPFAVLVSLLFWTWLWGNMGLVLAVPLTVGVVALAKNMPQGRALAMMLEKTPGRRESDRGQSRRAAA